MKKIAIILDSHSMRSEAEVKALGFHFLPQITILDGVEHVDGVELIVSRDADWQKVINAKSTKTSMPSIGRMTELFEKLSSAHEIVVYLPMTKAISGTYAAASAAAASYPKVKVIDNNLIGTGLVEAAQLAVKMAESGKTISEITTEIEKMSESSISYLIPSSLDGLIRSGRLKGIKKVILERAKLSPFIYMDKTEVKVAGLKRSFERALESALKQTIEKIGAAIKDFHFEIIHTGGEMYKTVEKMFKELNVQFIATTLASSPFTAYLNKNAIALTAYLKK